MTDPKHAADLLREAHEAIAWLAAGLTILDDTRNWANVPERSVVLRFLRQGESAIDAAVEAARREGAAEPDPDCTAHEWRRQMEAYGFDSVAKVLDMMAAYQRRGAREALKRVADQHGSGGWKRWATLYAEYADPQADEPECVSVGGLAVDMGVRSCPIVGCNEPEGHEHPSGVSKADEKEPSK